MATPTPDQIIALTNVVNTILFGAFAVGFPLCAVLTGVSCSQAYTYWVRGSSGSLRGYMAVASASLCFLSTVCETILLYKMAFMSVNGQKTDQLVAQWPLATQSIPATLAAIVSQAYFAQACYVLFDRSKAFVGYVLFLMVVMLIGAAFSTKGLAGIVINGLSTTGKIYSPLDASMLWMGYGAAMILDVSLSMGLYWNLASHKKTSVMVQTTSLLQSLMRTMLETYFLTAVTSITVLIVSVLAYAIPGIPETRAAAGYYVSVAIMTRIYSVSFLFTLNHRESAKTSMEIPKPTSSAETDTKGIFGENHKLRALPMHRGRSTNGFDEVRSIGGGVHVERQTATHIEHSSADDVNFQKPSWKRTPPTFDLTAADGRHYKGVDETKETSHESWADA